MSIVAWFRRLVAKPAPPPGFGGAGASGSFDEVRRLPRGLRNRNPGNIRSGPVPWKGEVGKDAQGFCVFESDLLGLRACAKLLVTYRLKHNLDCIEEIIGRWAPASENNTRAYVDAVARRMGVPPMLTLDVLSPAVLVALIEAIVAHENGRQPFPLALIREAVEMALEGQ